MINFDNIAMEITDKKIETALNRLNKWATSKPLKGFLILGDVGTGKSKILSYILSELQRIRYLPLFYANENDMFDNIRAYKDQSSHNLNHYKQMAKSARIGIYDDFGAFEPDKLTTQIDKNKIYYSIFDNMNCPLILTSNLSFSELESFSSQRVIDRILEKMTPEYSIDLFGVPSYRRKEWRN